MHWKTCPKDCPSMQDRMKRPGIFRGLHAHITFSSNEKTLEGLRDQLEKYNDVGDSVAT